MLELTIDDMRGWFCVGVAGNFAGHLEQAGEAPDFAAVPTASDEAPKGIFPFYVPGRDDFLGVFPISDSKLAIDAVDGDQDPKVQIEPEAAVVLRVGYTSGGSVESLTPIAIGAYNDCSIRRSGFRMISEKKNWGADSKGVATDFFPIDSLEPDGQTAYFRLASFVRRGEDTYAYGIDTPLSDYSYYGSRLLDWMIDRLNNQDESPASPLEAVGRYLNDAGRPGTLLAGIGATRYTPFGESEFLQPGDEAFVIVYDSNERPPTLIAAAVAARREDELKNVSLLRQTVYVAG